MDDAKFFVVQIQNGRYWDPAAPWETIQIMSCGQDAVEYAQHEADAGMQVRVVRYTMARTVLREWRLTRHAEETAAQFEASIAQRKAVIECALCGDDPGGKYRMTWYRRAKTGAVYCGACVAKMLAAPVFDEMRICDALDAMGLRLIDPDEA